VMARQRDDVYFMKSHIKCVRLYFYLKHILMECTNCRTFAQNISQSSLLESCLKALTIVLFDEKPIFISNCNVCYFNFILALKPWFYTQVVLFVSDYLILFLLTYLLLLSIFHGTV